MFCKKLGSQKKKMKFCGTKNWASICILHLHALMWIASTKTVSLFWSLLEVKENVKDFVRHTFKYFFSWISIVILYYTFLVCTLCLIRENSAKDIFILGNEAQKNDQKWLLKAIETLIALKVFWTSQKPLKPTVIIFYTAKIYI